MGRTLAITGGTGFVGGHLLDAVAAGGHVARALTRRPQRPRPGVEWVPGDLRDAAALDRLCAGAGAVIHVAGVVNAANEAGFRAGNVEGTNAMLDAALRTGVRRFVHVSSLAAREPGLSLYGASKAEADALVRDAPLDWTIVRPPGVYGPGDTELLPLFKAARAGVVPLPGAGRASMIHARDLADALLALALAETPRETYEIDDGNGGYRQGVIAATIGQAVGRAPFVLYLPAWAVRLGARIDTARSRRRGVLPKLSIDRARYLLHPDWTADAGPLMSLGLWEPRTTLPAGLAETAAWYRGEGWL